MHDIYAFIQARTTSSRLPGKVLLPLPKSSKEVLLSQLINRLKKILPRERIAILVPNGDKPILEFATRLNIQTFEGSEHDVRDRFVRAAKHFQAKTIIRLTADNPAVDMEHIELLIEAFSTYQNDISSFENLPLGMGVEIFKTDALIREPKLGLEPRHTEHVSLHLKEYPEEFSFLKLKPFLEEEVIKTINQIRLTIDEEKDYQMMDEVYTNFSSINRDFAIRDIYNLYKSKPKMFARNAKINQKTFQVHTVKNEGKKVFILYADESKYGSGHLERCKILYSMVQTYRYQVDMGNSLPKNLIYDLYIIDHRDLPVPKVLVNKNILFLDNYNKEINNFHFPVFYTIPHPSIPFGETKENFLFPQIIDTFKSYSKNEKIILIYAGSLGEEETKILDEYFYNQNSEGYKIIRVGGSKSSKYNFEVVYRLSKYEFLQYLSNCEIFCSYFGQSTLEAYYLEKKIVLYSISDYHTQLARYFIDNTNSIWIGQLPLLEKIDISLVKKSKKDPMFQKNSGYKNLLQKINQLLKA